jgi:CTP synthase (UTP-ammonia lyase)
MTRIALLGDRTSHPSHVELDALIPVLAADFAVDAEWVPTNARVAMSGYDGLWLVPGSPYADDRAVYAAIRSAREGEQPFLGTCGGMQYAVIESLRNMVGVGASHVESDGIAQDNAVVPLACSLQGEVRLVTPVPGSRFSGWASVPFPGMHFCSFAPTVAGIRQLEDVGVIVGAIADDAGAEVLEWPSHPFFVTSLFQPHIGTLAGDPVHPLVRAFVSAAREREKRRVPGASSGL